MAISLETAQQYSPFLATLPEETAAQLPAFLPRAWLPEDFHRFAAWEKLDEEQTAQTLRRLRRLVLAQIAVRDLCGAADLAEVTRSMTAFADFAVNIAADFAHAHYAALYGNPVGALSGSLQRLAVVAMGKMGGGELNVSSDIDLIFIFPEAGETDGRRRIDNREFFIKVGQKIIALLHNVTAEGQVFRVDMRLRPDGDSGPLAMSETALEQYLLAQGREWERYAWIKARVVTPYANAVAQVVRPFIYRKYLDFTAYAAMRTLHAQIRRETRRRNREGNIKTGAGGIREIEFVAQVFQLIRGGRMKDLQCRGTQETLHILAQHGILAPDSAEKLLQAYVFLRNTEHRLQYWDDAQTQTLPENPAQQQKLAQSMGFADYAAFSGCLNAHRATVGQIFENVLGEPDRGDEEGTDEWSLLARADADEAAQEALLQRMGFADAAAVRRRLVQLRSGSRYRHMNAQTLQRVEALLPKIFAVSLQFPPPERTLERLLAFVENVMRRSAYLAMLQEHPEALTALAGIISRSAWVYDYLMRHPVLLDELLSARMTEKNAADWQTAEQTLADELAQNGDREEEMDILRHFQHAQIFRLSVQDLAGLWTIEVVSDELSALADLSVRCALNRAWHYLPNRHRETPRFAVIAYGKLGGKELGYASDLDLVYIYEDDAPAAAEIYTRLAGRLTSWLSATTAAGILYDIDLRLRPNGDAGFMATSFAALAEYQRTAAWTFEHQALTRARFIAGDKTIGAKFEALRHNILTFRLPETAAGGRDLPALKRDILKMREKIAATHPRCDDHVKYAAGGMVDIEFIVQYLVLAHAPRYPELTQNLGNIALLRMAAERGLIDGAAAQKVQAAYRELRRIQHDMRLRDLVFVPDEKVLAHYAAVNALWQSVFS